MLKLQNKFSDAVHRQAATQAQRERERDKSLYLQISTNTPKEAKLLHATPGADPASCARGRFQQGHRESGRAGGQDSKKVEGNGSL